MPRRRSVTTMLRTPDATLYHGTGTSTGRTSSVSAIRAAMGGMIIP
jgi:hypothetical protein